MRQRPYPQDCTLIWIYGMQINYITLLTHNKITNSACQSESDCALKLKTSPHAHCIPLSSLPLVCLEKVVQSFAVLHG